MLYFGGEHFQNTASLERKVRSLALPRFLELSTAGISPTDECGKGLTFEFQGHCCYYPSALMSKRCFVVNGSTILMK